LDDVAENQVNWRYFPNSFTIATNLVYHSFRLTLLIRIHIYILFGPFVWLLDLFIFLPNPRLVTLVHIIVSVSDSLTWWQQITLSNESSTL
jgi:hypothetical protein